MMSDLDKDIEILKELAEDTIRYKMVETDAYMAGAITRVLSELEKRNTRIKNLEEENELQHCDLQNSYSINNGLKTDLETWKKIAEMLAEEGNFQIYEEKYCDSNIFSCNVKSPKKTCKQCIIDWARNEVEKDE